MSHSRRSRKSHGYLVVKPQGKFTQRVQAVGPDHFGIVAIDGHFEDKAAAWDRLHKDPRWMRVKVAKSFSRLAFVLLTGRCVVPHPACQPRNSIYEKLLTFQAGRAADMAWVLDDLDKPHGRVW